MAERPRVDVVVPFVGTDEELAALQGRLVEHLAISAQDTVTVVDNRPTRPAAARAGVHWGGEVASSYYARNAGAACGDAPWIIFLDADVDIMPGLLEGYFEHPPGDRTGELVGAIETYAEGNGWVARYGVLRRHLSQDEVDFGLTANVAVRRTAFEALGGFEDGIRSGGDADFSYRLRDAGWALEPRGAAVVRHPTRSSLAVMLRVFVRYGSGTQWLRRRYPEFSPPIPLRYIVLWLASAAARAPLAALRGDRDQWIVRSINPAVVLASEAGRFVPNYRNAGRRQRIAQVLEVLRDRYRSRKEGARLYGPVSRSRRSRASLL